MPPETSSDLSAPWLQIVLDQNIEVLFRPKPFVDLVGWERLCRPLPVAKPVHRHVSNRPVVIGHPYRAVMRLDSMVRDQTAHVSYPARPQGRCSVHQAIRPCERCVRTLGVAGKAHAKVPVPRQFVRETEIEGALEGDVGSRTCFWNQDRVPRVGLPGLASGTEPVEKFVPALVGKAEDLGELDKIPFVPGEVPRDLLQILVRDGFGNRQAVLIFVYCSSFLLKP